ncbi:MAG: Ig-like domain-containing protein [Candidatus Margulisiibacteriota bacterium]
MKKTVIIVAAIVLFWIGGVNAFEMRSGYYVGSGVPRSITGLGLSPDLVIIKADTAAGRAVWRSSAMASDSTAYFENAAYNYSGAITTLNTDGFSLGTDPGVNAANIRYTWVAFSGSGGNDFKVGSYTGTGADDRNITGLGFQPNLAVIKRDGASLGVWSTSKMGADNTHYFSATAPTADRIQALQSDGFQVGSNAEVNLNGQTYYYFTFKAGADSLTIESYTGDGVDNRSIALGFKPDLVWVKQSAAANVAVMRNNRNYGDETQLFSATANAVDHIQTLEASGFSVGTNARVNANASVYYCVGFRGVPTTTPSGVFRMISGSYVGNGASQSIADLPFQPELVIIKSDSTGAAVFSSPMMASDSTATFATAAVNFVNGIVSRNNTGFTVGANAAVNSLAVTYRWIAFSGSGSSNFTVGAYTGTGLDNRSITGLGFTPDLVVVKRNAASLGVFKTSAIAGDATAYFSATADTADRVQSLETDGFQIGANAEVNTAASTYFYFAFKNTTGQCTVGAYTGNGIDNRSISGLGFRPGLAWIKRPELTSGAVQKARNLSGDSAQYFTATANALDMVQALETDGFQVGTNATVNANLVDYRYAAWKSTSTRLACAVQPTSAVAGTIISPSVQVIIQDADGNTDTADNSTPVTIAIANNPGGGTLAGTLTKTAAAGIVTFNDLSINKTGTGYTLNASASGLTSAITDSFNISPATAAQVVFSVQPATTPANSVITPEVQVLIQDALGNNIVSDSSTQVTVSLGSNPAGGTLAGTLTKTATNGTVVFNDLSSNNPGSGYTLTANASGLTAAVSNAFTISPPPNITTLTPTSGAINIRPNATLAIQFSQVMDQPSTINALTLKAIRDNNAVSLESPAVSGSSTWDASGQTLYFTPLAAMEKGYTYQATISTNAKNADLGALATAESWSFTVTYDQAAANTFYSSDGKVRVVLAGGALPVDGLVDINQNPITQPRFVDPAKITLANSKAGGAGSITELNAFDAYGSRVSTSFASSVTLTFFYDDLDNDGVIDGTTPPVPAANLMIYRLDESHGLWVRLPGSTVDLVNHLVSAPITGFSVYALMATSATDSSAVFTFPNPYKPSLGHSSITFSNIPTQGVIKIFTLSGDLVKTISNTSNGQFNWDARNEAGELLTSGLYFYVVKATGGTSTGKLVIIR